ncbi:hypothetical protein O6H91_23G022400 [Diphasiastrum complanatum]|uniref:Uncharacterized protein n=2 Tax=Diphasiastrum complanatum TaxID=34168 RepID=A0ACC2A999_DIPCM|nr:hypothetical protein O6H91_23G022400 [Diphasiastrum complanatum]KAJ7514011.1 hypothetical protein O6H91_23G022400 [Diphasiastrum complanatum]
MGDVEAAAQLAVAGRASMIAAGVGEREDEEVSAGSHSQKQPRMQDEIEGKDIGKDAVAWSAQATETLLQVYAEKWASMNCRNFRGEEWEALASSVNERCSFTAWKDMKNGKQCSYKMSNLKRKYKSEKEVLRLRGGLSEWKWFSRMEDIFASHPKYLSYGVYGDGGEGEGAHAAEAFDNDGAYNAIEDPNSSSLPASKSASTTNTDGGLRPHGEMQVDSSPRSNTCKLRGVVVGKPPRKKHAISNHVDDFAASISESMKMMAKQQGEMIALMREMVASQDKQLHEVDGPGILTTREVVEIRKKIESIERDLVPLKQICTKKEMELKGAMEAYDEKSKLKGDLVNRLIEVVTENDRLKMRKLIELHRHTESMTRHHSTAQYVP